MEDIGVNEMLNDVLNRGFSKVEKMENHLNEFPHITKQGEWLTFSNGHWTGGFWTGLLWLLSLYKSDAKLKEKPASWAKKLKVRMNDNKTHDMGFIFGPSCILGNHISNNKELREMATAGAYNMKDLYEERSGLVLAWDEPGYEGVAIVDTIMNLPVMIWSANENNQPELQEIANTVASNIMKYHIREDFSTYHTVRWDTETYQIVEQSTHQGYSSTSCWSRGQAWALYGFSNMFRYTNDLKYLQTSEKLATYFWDHLDEEVCLPRWDFVFKNNKNEPIDASAASIAASGMLLLSDMLAQAGENEKSDIWGKRGEKIVQALISNCFYSDIDKYGLIEKATVDKPRGSGIGESTMYGDYYFMEAVYRLDNRNNSKMLNLLY